MKRDMALVRAMLLYIEANEGEALKLRPFEINRAIEGSELEQINRHLDLMEREGRLDLHRSPGNLPEGRRDILRVLKLTPKGHDFLDDLRDKELS